MRLSVTLGFLVKVGQTGDTIILDVAYRHDKSLKVIIMFINGTKSRVLSMRTGNCFINLLERSYMMLHESFKKWRGISLYLLFRILRKRDKMGAIFFEKWRQLICYLIYRIM